MSTVVRMMRDAEQYRTLEFRHPEVSKVRTAIIVSLFSRTESINWGYGGTMAANLIR